MAYTNARWANSQHTIVRVEWDGHEIFPKADPSLMHYAAILAENVPIAAFDPNFPSNLIAPGAFGTISVAGQSSVSADAPFDSLTLAAGSNITITTDAENDTVTIAASAASDPWTYIKLASDFTTSSATAVDITGMSFAPSADLTYEIEARLLLRTATTTVGPRTGIAWPTGMIDGVAKINVPTSATAQVMSFGNINASMLAAVGGLPSTTLSYPSFVTAVLIAGSNPAGSFRLQMASETAGTVVTVKAGSFLKYRTL